jgi:hypothetical protein
MTVLMANFARKKCFLVLDIYAYDVNDQKSNKYCEVV